MTYKWKHGKRGEAVRAAYGPYQIYREPYGTKWIYQGFLNGERIPLAFSSRLMDVKAYVEKHHVELHLAGGGLEVVTKGPGSGEGFGEMRHWSGVNRALSAVEKDWLRAEARKHMSHPAGLIALRTWIADRRRTRAHAEQLCKRWGVEMPTREELVERRDA